MAKQPDPLDAIKRILQKMEKEAPGEALMKGFEKQVALLHVQPKRSGVGND